MTPGVAPKAGASKHFQPIRLFETDENMPEVLDTPQSIYSVQRKVKPDPTKYKHFDFADGSDPADAPQPGVPFDKKPKTKHDSQWSFDDFTSPERPAPTRTIVKSFLGSVDDEDHQGPSTPQNKAPPRKLRRDDETHFSVGNDGPSPEIQKNNRGAGTNAASHLYDDDLIKADGSAPSPAPRALNNITNAKNREKHFEPHFEISDESPQAEKGANGRSKASENRQAAQRGLESHWSIENESPVQRKENSNTGITIAGDGMGSRKGFEASTAVNKGITIAGDGMGGKKGTQRNWLTEEEEPQDLHLQNRNPGKKQTLKSDNFWDF